MSLHPRARTGLLCPVSPEHGPLIPWTGSDRFGWYCPHDGHSQPQTRAFFTTEQAERGSLAPEPLTGADTPARDLGLFPAAAPLYPETDSQPTSGHDAAVPGTSIPSPARVSPGAGPATS